MHVGVASRPFWALLVAVPLGLATLGCAGGVTDEGVADEGDDDDDDDDDGDGDGDDDDDMPDNVKEERSGRWVPAKGFTFELMVDSGGDDRTALVHVPKGDKRKKLPLVIGLHGGKGGSNAGRMTPYFEAHDDEGVVFAFPNSLPGGERTWAGPDDTRDIDFVEELIDELDDHVGIDRDQVYVTGFSDGAGLAWTLACERPKLFAGFGHVQQALSKDTKRSCKPKAHKPFIWFHGDDDKRAPWDGTKDTLGVDETMAFWLDEKGCRSTHDRREWMPDVDKDDGTHPEYYRYESCKEVSALHLYRIKGGAHSWPSMEGVGKEGEGRSRDLDATKITLEFWKEHAGLDWKP